MEIYLAGDKPIKDSNTIKQYLAKGDRNSKVIEQYNFMQKIKSPLWDNISVLESFYYIAKNKVFPILWKEKFYKKLLLDSGAFTFMSLNKTKIDWDKYIEQYAEFIGKYDIDFFLELDIDNIIGLKEVERLRERLHQLTGKKSIPVWHLNRGKEYFIDMCKQYPYIAIGGLAIAGGKKRKILEKYLEWFISMAHRYNTKIHGLGYTSLSGLQKHRFDSVDSTAWLQGNRSGYIFSFDPNTGKMTQIKKENKKLRGYLVSIYNFNEWLKLQDYARKYL